MLAGIVQGVVVQMMMSASTTASGPFTTGNFTQIVGETWSRYSTSASASAVCSTGDHITGLEPRYSMPDVANFRNSSTITASASKAIVV